MPRIFPLSLCAVLWLSGPSVGAECKDLKQFIKDETLGAEKYVDTFSFRHDHRADSVLMLVKETIAKGNLPKRWLFLHRAPNSGNDYCVAGRGEEFGQHDDSPETLTANNFGPPGSGLPKCATSSADIDAGALLRGWAKREFDHAIVLYTVAKDTPGYQFVIADDKDWIIIEDQNENPRQSCFFDRGSDVFMRFNTTVINR